MIEQKKEAPRDHDTALVVVRESVERVGVDFESLSPEILERLVKLELESEFNKDSRMIRIGVSNVLHRLKDRSAVPFDESDIRQTELAALVHDIGKSGPVDASEDCQHAVIAVFGVRGVQSPRQGLFDFVRVEFPDRASAIIETLSKEAGADETTTMRDFWDKHAQWTHDILEAHPRGIDERARRIAGSHHIDRGIDPYRSTDPRIAVLAGAIGILENYIETLEERVLIVVDKYEAAFTRSGMTHESVMRYLRDTFVDEHIEDESLHRVLEIVDELGTSGQLFGERVLESA